MGFSSEGTTLRTYVKESVAVVHKTREKHGGLSNMAAGFPLIVNGVRVHTSEALYQACRYPNHPAVQKSIIGQISPMTAKMKSRAHKLETRSDWNNIRVQVMRWCLRVKLAQHYDKFGELLLQTDSKPIVELSRKDDFWGAKERGELLVGQNILGRLLMELRELVRADNEQLLRDAPILNVPNFIFLGDPISNLTSDPTITEAKGSQPDLF